MCSSFFYARAQRKKAPGGNDFTPCFLPLCLCVKPSLSILKRIHMIQNNTQKTVILFLLFLLEAATGIAQTAQPKWWFGISGAANINQFRGTTQMINQDLTVPTAFHKGDGIKPYFSALVEYRPKKLGFMLNLAYDNRGGSFDQVMAPCDCPANLSTNISYVAIEPSIRYTPFRSGLYIFAGPTISINASKEFHYTQDKQPDIRGDWSDIRKVMLSGQAGIGIDIPVSESARETQMTLSPFVSFQTDLGHAPRTVESWLFYTIRAGIALKLGTAKRQPALATVPPAAATPVTTNDDTRFSVRTSGIVPANRQVKETFPLRHSVFFDNGSATIPARYIMLDRNQAAAFREEQLQQNPAAAGRPDANAGRSARQMTVYHNILNIIGDRLRSNKISTITLSGASEKNPAEARQMAEHVKQYLVNVFGISASRISTEGRDKPLIPSAQEDAKRDLDLLREGDHRVDIINTTAGAGSYAYLQPVQINVTQGEPMDSRVVFINGNAAALKSWSLELTDEQGKQQRYGPFTGEEGAIPGKTILGTRIKGEYKVVMLGETRDGKPQRRETALSLATAINEQEEALRYSILFEFDRSRSVESYAKFLADQVIPLIPDNSTVIIHGHTDIIGEEKYNQTLSLERARNTQQLIARAATAAGRKGVRFETYGFGEDPSMAPFDNGLPEERFYNRAVIIDISGKNTAQARNR